MDEEKRDYTERQTGINSGNVGSGGPIGTNSAANVNGGQTGMNSGTAVNAGQTGVNGGTIENGGQTGGYRGTAGSGQSVQSSGEGISPMNQMNPANPMNTPGATQPNEYGRAGVPNMANGQQTIRQSTQIGGDSRTETGFQMVNPTPGTGADRPEGAAYQHGTAQGTQGTDSSVYRDTGNAQNTGTGQGFRPAEPGRPSYTEQPNSMNGAYRPVGGTSSYNGEYQAQGGPETYYSAGAQQGGTQNSQYNSSQYGQFGGNDGPSISMDKGGSGGSGGGGQQPPKKKRSGSSQLVAIILVVVLAVGCGFGGGVAAMYFVPEVFGVGGGTGSSITINPDSKMDTAEAIAAKVMPSVVGISTQSVQESPYAQLFGMPGQSIMEGVGTGIIVDEKGYILTNSHVVNDGDTKSIKVQFYDGTEKDGSVLWNDKTLDLAIVKVDAKNLTAAELGDSDEVNIGAYAVAIGNPLGLEFQRSVTQGIVSGLDRSISITEGSTKATMDGLIQTDASINSGNSGGPLLNSRGQVIGINSAKVQSGEGLGFAIPINTAKPIIDEIKEKGEFTRAYIGIEAFGLGDYAASYPQTDLEGQLGTKEGVYVQNVTAGGGAEAAGVQNGDVITEINGEKVTSMNNLNSKLIKYRPGEKVKLTIIRDKKSMEIEVTLKAGATV